MHSVLVLTVIFGGIVAALAVIGTTVLAVVKIIRGGGISPKGQKIQTEDARIIQEIYLGLSKMEERIETLETILLDKDKKRKQDHEQI